MPWSADSPPKRLQDSLPGPSGRPPLVVICGPTAIGKSALALSLSARIRGLEIVSADSRQVYRGMDIGTDKVSPQMRASVPHHCLDLVDPDGPFTVADYLRAAHQALSSIARQGRAALLVGGTGLYLRAVARGLPIESTGTDAVVRGKLEKRSMDSGLAALVAELERVAPSTAAATDIANPRRVIRALERVAVNGDRPPPPPQGYPAPVMWLGLTLEPNAHRGRIAARAAGQFRGGLLEEAALLLKTYGPQPRAFSAFGYREAFGVLGGQLTADEAMARTVARTWAYGRRQRTWFRSEGDVTWLDAAASRADEAATEAVEDFLAVAHT